VRPPRPFAHVMSSRIDGGRRRKSAAERRSQQVRSDARSMHRLLAGLLEVEMHRGNELSKVGRGLLEVLRTGGTQSGQPTSVRARKAPGVARSGDDEEGESSKLSPASMPSVPVRRDIGSPSAVEVVEVEGGSPHSESSLVTTQQSVLARRASDEAAGFQDGGSIASKLSPASALLSVLAGTVPIVGEARKTVFPQMPTPGPDGEVSSETSFATALPSVLAKRARIGKCRPLGPLGPSPIGGSKQPSGPLSGPGPIEGPKQAADQCKQLSSLESGERTKRPPNFGERRLEAQAVMATPPSTHAEEDVGMPVGHEKEIPKTAKRAQDVDGLAVGSMATTPPSALPESMRVAVGLSEDGPVQPIPPIGVLAESVLPSVLATSADGMHARVPIFEDVSSERDPEWAGRDVSLAPIGASETWPPRISSGMQTRGMECQTAETQTLAAESHAVGVQTEENASADLELLEEQMLHAQATMLILFQRLFDQKVFTMELFQECVKTMLGD